MNTAPVVAARHDDPVIAPGLAGGAEAAPMPAVAAPPSPRIAAHYPTTQWIAGEAVLLLAVPLPAMSTAQRRTAIPFAIEDDLAQPLDRVQVALGPELVAGTWLVAVIGHDDLARIIPDARPVLPDTLALPVPDTGWAAMEDAGRVLVRMPDGTGFASDAATLPALWQLAGSPAVLSYGGAVPVAAATTAALPEAPAPALARFDLMAAHKNRQRLRLPRGLLMAGVLVAVLGIGHLLIAGADLLALSRIESARADQLRSALTAAGQPAGEDLTQAVSRALAAPGAASDAGFLDLATRIFAPIADRSGSVSVTTLRYTAAQNSAVLTLEAADLGALQQIENQLTDSGLSVQSGAATTRDGAAEVQMTIAGGGA